MIAPTVFRRKLHIGAISKDTYELSNDAYWYIPVEVKASNWWKLVVADIEVRAIISYIDKDGIEQSPFAAWIETLTPVPSVTLRIGSIDRGIIIAQADGNQLLPLNGTMRTIFKDNQDIILELTSGKTILGRWRFPKAIVGGVMQEVSPIKIKDQK